MVLKSFNTYSTSIYLIIIITLCNCKTKQIELIPTNNSSSTQTLFNLLPAAQTHIDFQNTLTEGLNTNILMYEYFYNGGGVATGDFNNDGYIDLYFTANMTDNKFYLNHGKMQFEDITLISGTQGRPGPWKTGVTAVDINGDRLLDLYVCYSGSLPEDKRMNQLFINLGNNERGIPKFRDMAAEYGLNSPAFSTQSYFFDYDKDGDLDMILLNHNPKNLPLLNEQSTKELLSKDDPMKGTRLFRNDSDASGGKFNDVTQKAGINGSTLSYGLGIGISDLNEDGWPDFYVSNDYSVADYLYINNHNGTFTNQLSKSIGHTSQFSMGNDIADINNDGHQDIFTLDMLPEDNHRQKLLLSPDNYAKFDLNVRSGFYFQYMRNMLQLNNGDPNHLTFSEIGQLAGISNTDWSWSALFADYNDDGKKDLYITNGYRRDYTNLDFINYMDSYVKEKGRLMREDVMGIIDHMPASNVSNYMYKNETGITFKNTTEAWGLKRPSNSNGAAYADLDNDGDLDLIVNNINEPAYIYQNQGNALSSDHHFLNVQLNGQNKNTTGIGARVSITSNGIKQFLEQYPSRGFQSSVSTILHFGVGNATLIDTLIIQWQSGYQQILTALESNQLIIINEKSAIPVLQVKKENKTIFQPFSSPISLEHQSPVINDFDRQPLLINQLSFNGPCITSGDLNKDGLDDILFAGSIGMIPTLYIQQKNKSFIKSKQTAFEAAPTQEGSAVALFDADGDGYNDIYIASGGYHNFNSGDSTLNDRLYINDRQGRFNISKTGLPKMTESKGCAVPIDVNGDGFDDLFVGSQCIPGRYPAAADSYLLMNDGKGNFLNQMKDLAPALAHLGMVSDAKRVDLNNDKINDLIVVGQWMPVNIFINEHGKLVNRTSTYFDKEFNGWWNKIEIADLNKDGHPDLIVGNLGLNSQLNASETEPIEMYFSDFDHNGSVDPFLCKYTEGKSYPFVTRDELVKQLSMFRQRYPSFESYSNISIHDLFKESELKAVGHYSANHLETSVFISDSTGHFQFKSLPIQAQYAPVHTINIVDFDHDGMEDLLICGNEHHFKIRIGQADANYGVLLKGSGNGNFNYIDQSKSGLNINGDVRSAIFINNTLILGINNKSSIAYKLNK